jgi:hypothetical protein
LQISDAFVRELGTVGICIRTAQRYFGLILENGRYIEYVKDVRFGYIVRNVERKMNR